MRRHGGLIAIVALVFTSGLFLAPARAADGDIISTYAGGLGAGAATNVGQTPAAITVHEDADGDPVYVYVADTEFNVVRRITVETGHEEVFAGTGEVGYSGDGGPATEAVLAFRHPLADTPGEPGLAVDADGNLYIADVFNHRIRKVDPDGVITTIAGTGVAGGGGDGGDAIAAQLNGPSGLAVDTEGDLYIADTGNRRVRKLGEVFGDVKITTYAGNGVNGDGGDGGPALDASLRSPRGLALDPDGTLYISDTDDCRIRAVDAEHNIATFAGTTCGFLGAEGSAATSARLNLPRSVAVDAVAGDVYIADTVNCLVRRVDFEGRIFTAAGQVPVSCGNNDGGGVPTTQKLDLPLAVAMLADAVLIADTDNNLVRNLAGGSISTYAGNGRLGYSGDGGATGDAQVRDPWGVAVGADGSVYFSDWHFHVVRKIDPDGVITTVAGTGVGGYSDGSAATEAQLLSPQGLAVAADGTLFIADTGNCLIREVTITGTISTVAGLSPDPDPNCDAPGFAPGFDFGSVGTTPLFHPNDVDVDAAGHVFIANTGSHDVLEVDADRTFIRRIAGAGAAGSDDSHLDTPRGIAVAADGGVYIADTQNERVQVVEEGAATTFAGTTDQGGYSGDGGQASEAELDRPYDVDVGPDGLYIADTFNNVIRRVGADGAILTVAATGGRGFSGDGGPPTDAELELPHGVAASEDGVLYIADSLNERVRRVGPPPPTVPAAPVGVTGGRGDRQVTVSWSAPDDGGAPIETYAVYQDGAEEPVATVAAEDEPAATITGLTNGTAYTFTVTATNEVGESEPASTGPVTPRTVPGAPTGVSAKAGDAKATVSWTPPASTGGAPVTSYEVTSSPGGKKASGGGSATSATVTGLENGTSYTFTVKASNEAGAGPASGPSGAVTPASGSSGGGGSGGEPTKAGYWMVGQPGTVFAFGDAQHAGNAPVVSAAVDIEATPSGGGYWVLDEGGYVYSFGDAAYHGALNGAVQAGEKVMSMSATPTGAGYWLFTTAGRVATFGDAGHFGDMAGTTLNGPVLDSVATPSGQGYYMVASDGGVFAFGDAVFYGSMGGQALNEPVQSLTADPDGVGYWLVASDGGIFSFDAPFHGSMGGQPLNQPVTRMVSFGSAGYLMVATDGGIFSFGSAPFYGSLGASPPPYPIRSVAVLHVS